MLIDKPSGITSFGALRIVQRRLGIKKVGHAGTLDPLATGLLVVGVGKGTKSLATLVKLDKEYVAEIRIGEARTTGDMEGDVVATKAVEDDIPLATVAAAVASLVGEQDLAVSLYSAIKVNGVPLYKRARRAEKTGTVITERPHRRMVVYSAELLSAEKVLALDHHVLVVKVRFFVGSGTYIRSLAEELGKRLGYPACLSGLRRTKVGHFHIDDAVLPDTVGVSDVELLP